MSDTQDGENAQAQYQPIAVPQFKSLQGINKEYLANVWDERRKNYSDNLNTIHLIRNECQQKIADKQREVDYYQRAHDEAKQQRLQLEKQLECKDAEITQLKLTVATLLQKNEDQEARIQSQMKAILKAEQYNEKQQIVIEKLTMELKEEAERAQKLDKKVTELQEWKRNVEANSTVNAKPPPSAKIIIAPQSLRPQSAKKRSSYVAGETFSNLTREYVSKKVEEKLTLGTSNLPDDLSATRSAIAVKENTPSHTGGSQRVRRSKTLQQHQQQQQQQQQQQSQDSAAKGSSVPEDIFRDRQSQVLENDAQNSDEMARFKIRQLTNFMGFDHVSRDHRIWSTVQTIKHN